MTKVKLYAHDARDLEVIAAHLQDAIVRVGDLAYVAPARRFAGVGTRFCWEHVDVARQKPLKGKSFYRTQTGFHFDGVLSVRARGFDQSDLEAFLVVLELSFEPADEGAGAVRLAFAGGGEVMLDVECLDAALTDLSAPWPTDKMPRHDVDDKGQG